MDGSCGVTIARPILLLAIALAGCGGAEVPEHLQIAGGDPARGMKAIQRYGCGTCHAIPGVNGANGLVGPPLDAFGNRSLIAGQLPNRPAVLVAWIADAPALIPATGMPDLGVTQADAKDMAAYLYTLRIGETMEWPPEVPPDRRRYDDPGRPEG